MKNVVLACLVLAVGAVAQQQPQQQETVLHETKLATRVLPADVLRGKSLSYPPFVPVVCSVDFLEMVILPTSNEMMKRKLIY